MEMSLYGKGRTRVVRLVAVLFPLMEPICSVGFTVFGIALVTRFINRSLADARCSTHLACLKEELVLVRNELMVRVTSSDGVG